LKNPGEIQQLTDCETAVRRYTKANRWHRHRAIYTVKSMGNHRVKYSYKLTAKTQSGDIQRQIDDTVIEW